MKNLIYIVVLCLVSNIVLAQTDTENYVQSTSYQVETTDGEHKAGTTTDLTAKDKIESITYFDGLGRPIQSIAKQAHRLIGAAQVFGFQKLANLAIELETAIKHKNLQSLKGWLKNQK